ncbi:MAG: transcriptional regulator [Alcaligenaceae bacterium]|nr:MAG: transcriptional regulator [Alcaligenaceae bacterium]
MGDTSDNATTRSSGEQIVRSTATLGEIARRRRKDMQLTQNELAGLGGTGNRFIVDLESGKPTMQIQKVLDALHLLGLEVVVRAKTKRGLL